LEFPQVLSDDEPQPAAIVNPDGASPFLLIGDHGGKRVPRALANLGLPNAELARHIGWDIGVTAKGEVLSAAIDATFIHQRYSRLVIDCNRDPDARDAMPAVSDGTVVPGNAALDAVARAARVAAIHAPYHAAIGDAIARRTAAGQPTALVALHSFTPMMRGVARPWHSGILHNGANDALARAMLAGLRAEGDLVVGDNEPYAMDSIDYTIPRHAFVAGLPYVEIEVRQDLLADAAGIAAWAARLGRLLLAAADTAVCPQVR
jgi:predicted N-formylglutamate amidohydrolase